MSDPRFRELALRDGSAAVAEVLGTPTPAGFAVRFVDNAKADMTVVLPDPRPAAAPGELDEAELAAVAGGTIGVITQGCIGFTNNCLKTVVQLTACNPSYTKKPGSPAFCPE